jgi:AcrR family transcriptional regulator
MVMRYYESKEGLFASAAVFDLNLPDLSLVRHREIGRTLARHFLSRWHSKVEDLPSLLRMAVTHEQARKKLIDVFTRQIVPTISGVRPPKQAQTCAALVATQLLGLALTRFVLRLPAVVALSEDVIVEQVGATLQRYLAAGGGTP